VTPTGRARWSVSGTCCDPRMTFKIGDRVLHKSGGPLMAVTNPKTSDGGVWCEWFNPDTKVFSGKEFRPEVLDPYKE
jgi:uncharacterized protein YodC (DUF2158 family)